MTAENRATAAAWKSYLAEDGILEEAAYAATSKVIAAQIAFARVSVRVRFGKGAPYRKLQFRPPAAASFTKL